MPGDESRRVRSCACRGRYGPPGTVSTHGPGVRAADPRSRRDLFDDDTFRVRVVLDVLPFLPDQIALRRLVQLPVVVVGPEPVAEADHPVNLSTPGREHVEVDVRVR